MFTLCFGFFTVMVMAQQTHKWQQKVAYTMQIDFNVESNTFTGKQQLVYSNQSPDKLNRVFFHLYLNAFQSNSSMDVRSREIGKKIINGKPDWDSRVQDRISKLQPDEIGYQRIKSIKMNGVTQKFIYHETILEVQLNTPILPGTKVTFDIDYEAQVPLQVRRTGRDNPKTGVRYSMSQWYPKMCAYDENGWHPNPYVAREFYGVFGDYDVSISIDKNYKLGATGVLQNASSIGWGYDVPGTELKAVSGKKRTWRFKGSNIHDFVWAADPDYVHIRKKTESGVDIHVIYKPSKNAVFPDPQWEKVADATIQVFPFIEKHFGKYTYPQYSFIHGGDGGMEYAMATLIQAPSLGTAFHELMHNWYQMVLGFNESLYAWMDEGFTNYAEDLVMKNLTGKSSLQGYRDRLAAKPDKRLEERISKLPEDHSGAYDNYYMLAASGFEEPLTTHADHFSNNFAYSLASYSKGEVFLEQLGYIVGAPVRDKVLLEFYNSFKFSSPDVNDFMRLAENVSGLELDWYKEYWVQTTKTIDYSIDSLWEENGKAVIRLARKGEMPMPVDVKITFKDGSVSWHQIPLNLMYGSKKSETDGQTTEVPWKWTHPLYQFSTTKGLLQIKSVEIDPSKRMADIDQRNNILELNW
jgi:hypothetical protein